MSLWITSRKRIIIAIESSEYGGKMTILRMSFTLTKNDPFPNDECRSSESPVNRDLFLRTILPKYKSRSADLARIGKAFLWDVLLDRFQREPTPDEIADAYGRMESTAIQKCRKSANVAQRGTLITGIGIISVEHPAFGRIEICREKSCHKKIPSLRLK